MEDMEIIIDEEENIEEIEGTETGSGISPVAGVVIGGALTVAIIAAVKGIKKLVAKHKAKKEQEAFDYDFESCDEAVEDSAE